jgi:hypothetical protein
MDLVPDITFKKIKVVPGAKSWIIFEGLKLGCLDRNKYPGKTFFFIFFFSQGLRTNTKGEFLKFEENN